MVPTYRESSNLRALTSRVFAATRKAGIQAELIIVDDNSQDGTENVVAALAAEGYEVRVMVRTTDRGLSSAVLAGSRRHATSCCSFWMRICSIRRR